MLMIEEVRNEVARIKAMAGDDEAAHSAEDQLHANVLAAIADGHPFPEKIALEALRTLGIEFARWCA